MLASMRRVALITLIAIAGADHAWAQRLTGRVTDQAGTPVAAATVVASPDGGGRPITATSDVDGRFSVALPQPGGASVVVSMAGFVDWREHVTVGEGGAALDARLARSTFAEDVRVAANLSEVASTASRLGLARRETPASIDVVTQDVIQARGADTASTALRHVTGVTSSLRPGASAVFSSRGFVENSLGVLFNGIRVQSSTVTMRNYDAFNFARVEVLRGPASVLHGEGLSAGAINFVRREPTPGRTRAEGLFEAGAAGRLRVGAAAAGSAGGASSYSVSFARNRFDTHVESNTHEYAHLTGGARTNLGQMVLGLEGDWLSNSVDDPYWGTPLIDGRIDQRLYGHNFNRSSNNRYDDTVWWGRLTIAVPLSRRAIYNGQVYRYQADRDWRNSYGFEFQPVTRRVLRRAVENLAYDHRLWGTRHDVTTDFTVAGRTGRFVAGVDAAFTDFSSPRSYGPRVSVDAFDPESLDFEAPDRADDRRANTQHVGVYSELRLDLLQRLTAIAGGRAARLSNDIRRPASSVAFDQTFTPTDGRLGLVFTPVPAVSAYAQLATGSEPIEALLILGPAESALRLARSRLWEGGVKATAWDGRIDLTGAVYRLAKRDLTTTDPENATRTVQIGRQSSRGIELSLIARPTDQWLFEANAAALDARYDLFFEGGQSRNGNLPPNVPELVFNLGASWQPFARLETGFWLTHIGRRTADTTATVFQSAYTLIDPFVRVTLGRRADVTLRVRNATDRRYVEWATRAFGVTNVYFGEPRRAIVSLRLRL